VAGPAVRGGFPVWSGRCGPVQVRFVGRAVDRGPYRGQAPREPSSLTERAKVLAAVEGRTGPLAALRQIHSDRVLPARAGIVGEGDALCTGDSGLVLSVVTADCVPVILAGPVGGAAPEAGAASGPGSGSGRGHAPETPWALAAVHAGWRGIVTGVVPRAVEALAEMGAAPPWLAAWIGPAIGTCCYEVSDDVAAQVASAAGAACVVPQHWQERGSRPDPELDSELDPESTRPHLDLVAAVRHQLTAAGVPAPRIVLRCTRCDDERLWSYRRDGRAAGRNHAFAWLAPSGVGEVSAVGEAAAAGAVDAGGTAPCD